MSDDYINENDGRLYCGKCGTPREIIIKLAIPERDIKVPMLCKCRAEIRRQEEALAREQERAAEIRHLKATSMMDEKFRGATFECFKENKFNARQLASCRKYAESFGGMKNQGLLLYGGVGTGKTYMAACIANYLMDCMTRCIMTSFVTILQAAYSFRGDEAEQKYIDKLNRADLLIIDDLGAERNTDYALEKVYNIIDSRYRTQKPMILTTNLTLREMQGNADLRYARIYDRIFEVCYPVEFTGGSWRKDEAARRYDQMTKFLEGAS